MTGNRQQNYIPSKNALIADVLRGPVWEAWMERTYRDREIGILRLADDTEERTT